MEKIIEEANKGNLVLENKAGNTKNYSLKVMAVNFQIVRL
jgi:hypothetical protein